MKEKENVQLCVPPESETDFSDLVLILGKIKLGCMYQLYLFIRHSVSVHSRTSDAVVFKKCKEFLIEA